MLLLLLSCSDHNLQKRQDANAGASPIISVTPNAIDFGVYDSTALIQEIEISNIGEGKLQVEPPTIAGDSPSAFSFVSPSLSMELLEGESQSHNRHD